MKNREKYKNELIKAINDYNDLCEFMKEHEVYRMIGKDLESLCEIDCVACGTALQLWLDEEYIEPLKPEVDWSNVPVDTLVRVKDVADDVGVLRYFKGIDACNPVERFVAWADGKTSVTANGSSTNWAFCELVEEQNEE